MKFTSPLRLEKRPLKSFALSQSTRTSNPGAGQSVITLFSWWQPAGARMFWGSGSALGFLAILGYVLFAAGAVLLWNNRLEVPTWMNDEMGAIRRSLIRHAVVGGFGGLREETRFKLGPTGFLRRLG